MLNKHLYITKEWNHISQTIYHHNQDHNHTTKGYYLWAATSYYQGSTQVWFYSRWCKPDSRPSRHNIKWINKGTSTRRKGLFSGIVQFFSKEDPDVGHTDRFNIGIIRPSRSSFASNIVLVKKKSGALRKCVDYRQLNKNTKKDSYALRRIE